MLAFLKSIDFYGRPLYFTTFKQTYHKTSFGGVITIMAVCTFIFTIFYFGQDFYLRKNPTFVYQHLSLPNYPNYTINNSNFAAFIRIEDDVGNQKSIGKYLQIIPLYYSVAIDPKGVVTEFSTNIDTNNCSMVNFTVLRLTKFRERFEGTTCLSLSNLTIGGYWDTDYLSYVSILVKPCENNTNNVCETAEKIYDFINTERLFINVYTIQQYLDLTDFQQPLKTHLFDVDLMIDTSIEKTKNLFFKQSNVYTDYGLISDMKSSYSIFSLEESFMDFVHISGFEDKKRFIDKKLAEFNFYFRYNVDNFSIYFMKLQQFFASIGGVLIIVHLFFDSMIGYVNKHDRTLKIMNKLFDFSKFEHPKELEKIIENLKKEEVDNTANESRRKFRHLQQKDITPRDKSEKYDESVFEMDKVEIEKPKKRELFSFEKVIGLYEERKSNYKQDISIFLILKSICFLKYLSKQEAFNVKIFNKSKKIIDKKIDVVNYLKFYQEYSIVKTIIFNDITNLCLTLAQKPNLYESNSFNRMHLTKHERVKKLFDYFSQKDFYSANDRKLLDIILNEVKQIIAIYKENCYMN